MVAVRAAVVDRQVVFGTVAIAVLIVFQSVAVRREHIAPVKVIGLRQMAAGIALVAATTISASLW